MDFEKKKKELEKESIEKQSIINRSQQVISLATERIFEIRGELKIVNEIQQNEKNT